ncbi:MAG: adenylosuccinate synthetase [Spirochaetia bacterium]|nr:adenylosuccinate synthetase [Spirochaetia bacterium]
MGVGEAILDLERGLPGIRLRDLLLPGSVSNLRNLQESKVEIAENLFAQWDAATNCGSNVKAESEQEIEIKTLVSDLKNPALLRIFLERLVTFLESIQIGDRGTLIEKLKATRSVFEGAQGVLLDRDSGFFPYVTPSNTTFANADEILKPFAGEVFRIGIVRGYMTRHGAGPLVTEIDSSLHMNLKDEHNLEGAWQGSLRVGWFDAVAIRHAIRTAGGPNYLDGIAVTNLDRLPADSKFCAAYDTPTERIRDLPDASGPAITDFLTQVQPVCELVHPTELMARIKEELEANIILTSNGSGPEHKTFSTD